MANLPNVEIDGLPETTEDFQALQDWIGRTPQGAAALMVLALLKLSVDEVQGARFLALAIDRRRLDFSTGFVPRKEIDFLRMQINEQPFLPKSYFCSTDCECGYLLPHPPWVMEFSYNNYSGDMESGPFKVYVGCTGADSPRPVTVAKGDDGIWRAQEWSSLVVGVRSPSGTEIE